MAVRPSLEMLHTDAGSAHHLAEGRIGVTDRVTLRALWQMTDRLRSLQPHERQRSCGRRTIGPVEIAWRRARDQSGEITVGSAVSNVTTCGSVWGCPVCAARRGAERVSQLRYAAERWHERCGQIYMCTLTIRHALPDSLTTLRRGVSAAWRRLERSRALYAQWSHSVRGLEVTHGRHGWHVHLHVLLFVASEWTDVELCQYRDQIDRVWAHAVGRELGEERIPDTTHGVVLTAAHCVDYAAKFGLVVELMQTSKLGRGDNRGPWQIAHDAAAGDTRSIGLWREYVVGMSGARQLTWSRSIKRELLSGWQKPQTIDAAVVLRLDAPTWYDCLHHIDGWQWRIREAAERAAEGDLSGAVRLALMARELAQRAGRAPVPWRGVGVAGELSLRARASRRSFLLGNQ